MDDAMMAHTLSWLETWFNLLLTILFVVLTILAAWKLYSYHSSSSFSSSSFSSSSSSATAPMPLPPHPQQHRPSLIMATAAIAFALAGTISSHEMTVVSAIHTLVLLTCLLRAIYFGMAMITMVSDRHVVVRHVIHPRITPWDPPSFLSSQMVPHNHTITNSNDTTAMMTLSSLSSLRFVIMDAMIGQDIVMAGSLSLISIFILILVYWSYILKKYYDPRRTHTHPFRIVLRIISILVIVHLLNMGINGILVFFFLLRQQQQQRQQQQPSSYPTTKNKDDRTRQQQHLFQMMIHMTTMIDSFVMGTVCLGSMIQMSISARRFRHVLQQIGGGGATLKRLRRNVLVTMAGTLFLSIRAILDYLQGGAILVVLLLQFLWIRPWQPYTHDNNYNNNYNNNNNYHPNDQIRNNNHHPRRHVPTTFTMGDDDGNSSGGDDDGFIMNIIIILTQWLLYRQGWFVYTVVKYLLEVTILSFSLFLLHSPYAYQFVTTSSTRSIQTYHHHRRHDTESSPSSSSSLLSSQKHFKESIHEELTLPDNISETTHLLLTTTT